MASQGKPDESTEKIGLGTAIEKVTRRAGIRPCRSCKKRKEALDRAVPALIPKPGPNSPAWLRAIFGDGSAVDA